MQIVKNGFCFEWNDEKAKNDVNQHKITFSEAVTIFEDKYLYFEYDESHSEDEERFKAIGISDKDNVLLVVHCYRENDTVIRIISARKASNQEKDVYNMRKGI